MDKELRESLVSQPGTSRLVTVEWCKDHSEESTSTTTSRNNLFCVSPSHSVVEEGGREWSWRFGKQRTARTRDECFLFTVELEGKERERESGEGAPFDCSRLLKVVIRSVGLGGQILSLRAGRRREAKFRERASVDHEASHWVVLQNGEGERGEMGDDATSDCYGGRGRGRGDGIQGRSCWLLNCSRPEVRLGPLRLNAVSPSLSLGRSPSVAPVVVSTSGSGENLQAPEERSQRERDSLLLEAKAVAAKLEQMIAGQTNSDPKPQSREGPRYVPNPGRIQPRRGEKWLATLHSALLTRKEKTSKKQSQQNTSRTNTNKVTMPEPASPSASYASSTKTATVTASGGGVDYEGRRVEAANNAAGLGMTPSVSECEAPAPKIHLPVPMKQNILAQIRQGVKLKTPAKPTLLKKAFRSEGDFDHTSENCDPACTPIHGKQQSGGLMSELRRNLAGRRKSIEGMYSPPIDSETEESSCNWSPLSVNN